MRASEPRAEELAVLRLLALGCTDEQVAARLGCSRRTVERLLRSAMGRLGAVSRFQAGVLAVRTGWLSAGSGTHSRQEAQQEPEARAAKGPATDTTEQE